jgi:hypothetical protein
MTAKICNVCGKRTIGTKGSDPMSARIAGLCGLCMDEGGWENTHSDNGHDAILAKREALSDSGLSPEEQEEIDGCWICYPELNEAANWKPKAEKPAGKATYVRRPQLNHKGHKHAQASKARRECKEAFWAWAASTDGPKDLTAEHFAAWGFTLNPQPVEGEPVAKTNTTPFTVAKRGPKGGVVKQTEAAKPVKVIPKACTCTWIETKYGSGLWTLAKYAASCKVHAV